MSEKAEDRRRSLVRAAIRVFAQKGFHDARVGDIAKEAGVAHGLLYHYFSSKEEVLETIFRETWTALAGEVVRIEESGAPLREQLRRFSTIFLGSWLMTPSLVRVMVHEVGRSPEVSSRVGELHEVFVRLRALIESARERGEVRADADPLLATWVFYGALEQILTGWAMGQLRSEDEDIDRAVAEVVDVFATGLAA
ncbi:MAG TPA: TetR/AcrR family transcriptional regulator [Gaiellaceae bacterium]|nr:TetR/AcrR family transcriptional regulator [Gaiellaceae bacterium]